MKALKEELELLKLLMNEPTPENIEAFESKVLEIKANYPSNDDANTIADFILSCYQNINIGLENINQELTVRQQLEEVKEVISLSYIAKKYFGKSKQWLNNRINGCIVNGKPCKFTEEEKQQLNYAISDIGKRLGSIRIL